MTSRQRLTLGLLTLALFAVIGLLTWSIWTATQNIQRVSPLATPTLAPPALTAIPSPTVTPTARPFFDPSEAGAIAREVEEAREVLLRWETPLALVNTYDLSVILYRRTQTRPPFPLSDRRTLDALDLWPHGEVATDPVAEARDMAARYFPEEQQIYLRRDWTAAADVARTLVAYGYAQALADQYGELPRLRAEPASLDRRLTLAALAEGAAFITLCRYAGVAPDSPEATALLDTLAAGTLPHWKIEHSVLERLTWLPLELGRDFGSALYEEEGLDALDEALRRPPRATAQILHPQNYAAWRANTAFEPLEVELGRGWELTLTETVGEALMGFAFSEWNQGLITYTVAGWDDDLLQVWDGPEGERVVLWQTAWKLTRQAVGCEEQLNGLLPRRVHGYVRQAPPPEGLPYGEWWVGRWGAAFLYRRSKRVWLIWGNDEASVAAVAAALP